MISLNIAPEHRADASAGSTNYTDILVSALLQQSRGETISARALGSQEIAAGIVSRAMSLATVTGDMGLLTTRVLAEAARDLVVNGEAIYKLDVDPLTGAVRLLRATSYSVHGHSPDPSTWFYDLSLFGPTASRMVKCSAATVLHVRYATLNAQPWRGLSPLRLANATGSLSARLTQALEQESSVANARIIPMPAGQSTAVSNAIRNLITQPESGRVVLPETTKGSAGPGSAPMRDYRADRLGFDAPASEEQLYRTLLMEIVSICGVPWSLAPGSGAAGPAIREGQRELLTGTVIPLARLDCRGSGTRARVSGLDDPSRGRGGGHSGAGEKRAHFAASGSLHRQGARTRRVGGMTWTLQDSVIDPLELDDALKTQARSMAGESGVGLTTDRENILLAAAAEIEAYCDKAWFRGPAGAARVATSVIEAGGTCCMPAVGALPASVGVTITSVEVWSDASEIWTAVTYIRSPLGSTIRVKQAGTYRIVASMLPLEPYPTVIGEAVARLFAFRENVRPRMVTGDMADGTFSSQAGGVLKSGAAELLRFVRIPGA